MNKDDIVINPRIHGIDRSLKQVPTTTVLGAQECINLIQEDGAVRPYSAPPHKYTYGAGRKFEKLYKHVNGKTYLFTSGKDPENISAYRSFYLEKVILEDGTVTNGPVQAIANRITADYCMDCIGNIVVFSCSSQYDIERKTTYALIEGNTAHELGELPPMPILSFSREDTPSNSSVIGVTVASAGNITHPGNYNLEEEKKRITDFVFSAVNQLTAKSEEENRVLHPRYFAYAIRMYDGEYLYTSPPILINTFSLARKNSELLCTINKSGGSTFISSFTASAISSPVYVDIVENKIRGTKWESVIKSIDIFCTKPIVPYDINKTVDNYYMDGADYLAKLPMLSNERIMDAYKNPGIFYKINSVDITSSFIPWGTAVGALYSLQNLEHSERMPALYNPFHKYTYSGFFKYNSKLHAYGIKTTISNGYDPRIFNYLYNTTKDWSIYNILHRSSNPTPNGYFKLYNIEAVEIKVKVRTEDGEKVVRSTIGSPTLDYNFGLPMFFCYPDVRAKEAIITVTPKEGSTQWRRFNLEPHPSLNMSYWIDPKLEADAYNTNRNPNPQMPTTDNNNSYTETNMFKVSGTNNPFYFPPETIYRIGVGKIIGMNTPTQAISQGQFGQFPLYVFCTDGVWTGQVGESAYSSFHPVSRDVAINRDAIVSIDNAVLFATRYGLSAISGGESRNITPHMQGECFEFAQKQDNGEYEYITLAGFDRFIPSELIPALDISTYNANADQISKPQRFNDVLLDAEIAYDHYNKRIYIVSRKNRNYMYCMNIDTGFVSKLITPFNRLYNSYPEAAGYDEDSRQVYDISTPIYQETLDGGALFVWISRPIYYPSTLVKIKQAKVNGYVEYDIPPLARLRQAKINGGIEYNDKMPLMLFGSRDGKNYVPVLAVDISLTDFRIFHNGSPFRYYIIAMCGLLPYGSNLTHWDVVASVAMNNRLR